MNLLCRAKMILVPVCTDARIPFRMLTLVASVGLLIGYGSLANGATPVSAAAALQDHDHKTVQDVHQHRIHSDSDGNIEVVVIQDDDSNDRKSFKILKGDHKAQLHELHSARDGNVEVLVLHDDEHKGEASEKLHRHFTELRHRNGSGNVDNRELARQLRQIADRLDATSNNAHAKHELHRDIEVHHGGDHNIIIRKSGGQGKSHQRLIELTSDAGKHVIHGKTGQPHKLIIEEILASDKNVHIHDGDHAKMILKRLKHDADHNVVVEELHADRDHNASDKAQVILHAVRQAADHKALLKEIHVDGDGNASATARMILKAIGQDSDHNVVVDEIHVDGDGNHSAKVRVIERARKQSADHNIVVDKIHDDGDHNPRGRKLHFGGATTSDEGSDRALRELKKELQQLREELNQLRSNNRPAPQGKRERLIEEHKTGLRELASDAAVRVIDRRKNQRTNVDHQTTKDWLWFEKADEEKSDDRILLKTSKASKEKATQGVFRFDFKSNDRKSDETSKGKKKD